MMVVMLAVLMMGALALSGCSSNNKGGGDKDKKIKLAYVAWDSEIASTNVVKEVLESKLGYDVEMVQLDAGPMYSAIADGSADGMVAAWLPSTHGELYYNPIKDKVEDLGVNLDGTKVGLVVPSYMDITSIEDLNNADAAKALDHTITGIEPGAGIMTTTETAIDAYALKDWTLQESSSAAMTKVLKDKYAAKEPVVVTGWTPHWMFADMDLKYLEDPKNVYGGAEQIHTLVRKGLKEDMPDAYNFLDKFNWTPDEMAAVMVDISGGMSEEEAAKKWVEANANKVDEWIAE
ncbi:glycine betaine ABC transporter substrate-binding protein [Paenibacillus sp. HB172176]|uniref:glycine betaine ABC transporter substrate-binding protein n=1 Tax=Paenibacillus sp. HB172176 TaxID=2493690 RepID=UPI001F0F09B1|nr:glycine betaine ABC transporter substrate-binding protein [Paenibacillus sp. HB172176]